MCDLHFRDDDQAAQTLDIGDFVDELVVAMTTVRIYHPSHPRVQATLTELQRTLEKLLRATNRQDFELGVVDGYLVHDKRPLLGASLAAQQLIVPLEGIGAGGVLFRHGATVDEFLALAGVIGRRMRLPESYEDACTELEGRGVENLRFLPPYRLPGSSSRESATLGGLLSAWSTEREGARALELDVPVKLYQRVVGHLQDVMIHVCKGQAVALDDSRELIEAVLKRMGVDPGAMLDLGRYERYDAFTFGHSVRVCLMALHFARSMTDNQDLLQRVGVAAMMHDIGKAWVPFEILHSTTRLSSEEREEMNRHTLHGGEILIGMEADPGAVSAAFGHHRYGLDGGYPETLHQARTSTVTRMVKICDVYEALTAVRPYKDPMSPVRAYRIMLSMKDRFDAGLLRHFISINGVYPVGSSVRLTTGELARVVGQTDAIDRPAVLLTESADGEPLESDPENPLDLSSDAERDQRAVAELVPHPDNVRAAA